MTTAVKTAPPPGLYIHIPFCRRKCAYCAFYSTADFTAETFSHYGQALMREAERIYRLRYQEEAAAQRRVPLSTLYIGGGTPSLLPVAFYENLLHGLSRFFDFSACEEATIEANPEHLTREYLRELYTRTPLRRLSIGVQSFFDDDLQRLNRKHTAKEALQAIGNARKAGYENLSVDLIFGLYPDSASGHWKENLRILASLQLPHFSAYALTVEPHTILEKQIAQGRAAAPSEKVQEEEYFYLQDFAGANGYLPYEISNYAKAGSEAVHNSNYWKLKPYIGLGAGAHSFYPAADLRLGGERTWNAASLAAYLELPAAAPISASAVAPPVAPGGERLTEKDLYHEYVMTALRTVWGVEGATLQRFSPQLQQEFLKKAEIQIKKGNLALGGAVRTDGSAVRTDCRGAEMSPRGIARSPRAADPEDAWIIPADKRFLTDGIALEFF